LNNEILSGNMNKSPAIVPVILLLLACTEKEADLTQYTTYDYRLYLKGNRIIETDYLRDDTVSAITKYYFSDKQVRVVSYGYDTSMPQRYILYEIGENGYAESSLEYPESITVLNESDSFLFSRRHYIYDAQEHLTCIEYFHYYYLFASEWLTLCTYSYAVENISGYQTYADLPYAACGYTKTYEYTDIPSKIDILNFHNGILGKENTKLVKKITSQYNGFCDPHTSGTINWDMTYTLDDRGYVIQSRRSTVDNSDARYPDAGNLRVIIINYDIRFLDSNEGPLN
jgi:hypothetical protein